MLDEQAWLNGLYVAMAIDATVGNAFREKGQQPAEYPSEPKMSREIEYQLDPKKKEQDEALWAEAWMNSLVEAGKGWGKKK